MLGLFRKIRFDIKADRLGPDCPFTHWKLYFKTSMNSICTKKFLSFGEGAEFRPHAYAINCSKIKLGKRVVIRPTSMLFADVRYKDKGFIEIEDDVLIGSGVHIYVSNHRFSESGKTVMEQGHFEPENTILKKGCWIGANSILLPGVQIGENSIVGAGSIVTRSIPDNSIAVGSPAKVIKSLV